MRVAIASIDDAYALSSKLDDCWHKLSKDFSESRRRSYLAGRALLQKLMAQDDPYFKLPQIVNDDHGKPCFLNLPQYHFNISHSGNLIAVAIGDSEMGIDIERIRKRHSMNELIKRVLSPREQNFIQNLDEALRLEDFILFWTLRECLLKLSGRGLGGLQDLSVYPDELHIKYPALKTQGHTVSLKTADILKYFDEKQDNHCWITVFVPNDAQCSLQILINGELQEHKLDLYQNNRRIFTVSNSN